MLVTAENFGVQLWTPPSPRIPIPETTLLFCSAATLKWEEMCTIKEWELKKTVCQEGLNAIKPNNSPRIAQGACSWDDSFHRSTSHKGKENGQFVSPVLRKHVFPTLTLMRTCICTQTMSRSLNLTSDNCISSTMAIPGTWWLLSTPLTYSGYHRCMVTDALEKAVDDTTEAIPSFTPCLKWREECVRRKWLHRSSECQWIVISFSAPAKLRQMWT